MRTRSAHAAAAGILACLAVLLVWNAFHYDWLRGPDAWHNSRYADVIEHEHRLPRKDETDVWHTPPLFFTVAVGVQRLAGIVGWPEPHKAVQLFSVLCVLAIATVALLLARELFPRSPFAQLAALALAASTPVLVRSATAYHPEPLAAALTVAGIYVLVRAAVRSTWGWRPGVLAGLLLGLANLTRTWALAALAAVALAFVVGWLWTRQRSLLRTALATLAVSTAFTAPWLAYKADRYGSPLAYSQPVPEQWRGHSRPRSFYTALDLGDVFGSPYSPRYRNHLLPVVYTDWWGDYWRYWDVPFAMVNDPPTLPRRLDSERRYQSYVGLLPSLLLAGGFVLLSVRAIRTRSTPLLLLLLPVAMLALSFVGFLVEYPKQDGDNIKALYLLNAVAPLAVCGGWALSRLARIHVFVLAGLALLAVEGVYLQERFLALP